MKKSAGRRCPALFFIFFSDFTHKLFTKLSLKLHRKLKIYALQKDFNRATPRRASAKTEEK